MKEDDQKTRKNADIVEPAETAGACAVDSANKETPSRRFLHLPP
jgi:hypothetical protein